MFDIIENIWVPLPIISGFCDCLKTLPYKMAVHSNCCVSLFICSLSHCLQYGCFYVCLPVCTLYPQILLNYRLNFNKTLPCIFCIRTLSAHPFSRHELRKRLSLVEKFYCTHVVCYQLQYFHRKTCYILFSRSLEYS